MLRGVDPDIAFKTAHGCRAVDTFAKLRPDLAAAKEIDILEGFEMTDFDDVAPLPGAWELLTSLPIGCWTVVTSASGRVARVRLKAGRIPLPPRLVVAEDVKRGKPHPDPYLAGAALLGLSPEDCVVFEDSSSGARAGRAAGCTVVATTFSDPIDTLDAAHYLIADLKGVAVELPPDDEGLSLRFTPLRG